MSKIVKFFFDDETGLELSEYAIAAAAIAIACVAAFTALNGGISATINGLKNAVTTS